jgi:hypothetical protein
MTNSHHYASFHGQNRRGYTDLISRDTIEVLFLQPIACLPYRRLHYIPASFFCWWVSTINAQPSPHIVVWMKSKTIKVAQSKVECHDGNPYIHLAYPQILCMDSAGPLPLYCFQCIKIGTSRLTSTPTSEANLAACTGSCGLLFPSTTEMRILNSPSDLLILSSIIPRVRGLSFLVFPSNGTIQFSYIQIVIKVTWISNS